MNRLPSNGLNYNLHSVSNHSNSFQTERIGGVAGEGSLTGKVNTLFGENQQFQEANRRSLEKSRPVRMERGEQLVDDFSFTLRLPSEVIESFGLDELMLNFSSTTPLEVVYRVLDLIPHPSMLSPKDRRIKEQFIKQCLTQIAECFWEKLNLERFCEVLLIVYPTLAFPRDGGLYKKLVSLRKNKVLTENIQFGNLACFTIGCYLLLLEDNNRIFKKKIYKKLESSQKYQNFIFIMNAMQSKNLDGAIHKLEQIKGYYQELANILKGRFLLKKGEFEKAIHDLTQVLTRVPYEACALTFRGEAYRNMGKLDLAIVDLNLALEINPNQERARCQRGMCRYQEGKMREAYEDFQKFMNQPEDLQAIRWGDSVDRLYEDCRYHITEDQLLNPLIHPNKVWADRWNHYSRLPQGWRKRWDDLFPNNSRNAFYLGRKGAGFLLEENFDKAYDYLTDALRVNPNDIFSLSRKGLYLILTGKGEEALSYFKQVFALDSKHLFSLCIRGQYFFIQGEESRALEDFNAVLDQDANHRLALLKRAEILFAQNKSYGALADLDKILKIDPFFILALALQARIFYALREFQLAKEKSNTYLCFQVNARGQLSYACTEEMLWIWCQCAPYCYGVGKLQLPQYLENMINMKMDSQDPYLQEKRVEILLEQNKISELFKVVDWNGPVYLLGDYLQYLKLKILKNLRVTEGIIEEINGYYERYSLETSRLSHFLYGHFSNRAFFLKLRGDYWYDNKQFDQAKEDYLSLLQFSPSCYKSNEVILKRLADCYLYLKARNSEFAEG